MNSFQEIYPVGKTDAILNWRRLNYSESFLSESIFEGENILKVNVEALQILAKEAFHDISHYLRTSHLVFPK